MYFANKIRRIYRIYREVGPKEFLKRIRRWFFNIERYIIVERDLTGPIEEIKARIPIEISRLKENEIDELTKIWPEFYDYEIAESIEKTLSKRLNRGEVCFVARHKNQIVFFNWFSTKNSKHYLEKDLPSYDEVLFYNVYACPQYRGNRLTLAVQTYAMSYFRKEGHKRYKGYIGLKNIASRKVMKKITQEKAILSIIRLLGHDFRIKRRLENKETPAIVISESNSSNGVPVFALSPQKYNLTFYSRYSRKVVCPELNYNGGRNFIEFLVKLGRSLGKKGVLFPTSDQAVLTIATHKKQLKPFFFLPLSSVAVADIIVNKDKFYRMLEMKGILHPKTFFPKDISEIEILSKSLEYPYIIKPVSSGEFKRVFKTKCFLANSREKLAMAYIKAREAKLNVFLQEVIPGNDIYMFYTYFNANSKPLAVCGYQKHRQYSPDFGIGCMCEARWEEEPINIGLSLLKEMGYRGIAEPEFKRDPRDGKYKLLEINARTSTQNRLPAHCGLDMEYIAYQDVLKPYRERLDKPKNGVKWIDFQLDLATAVRLRREGKLSFADWLRSLKGERTYAYFAGDDLLPFIVSSWKFFKNSGRKIFAR
jgi:predicted ATP-grasp superfamily ATP-dependent carboligase